MLKISGTDYLFFASSKTDLFSMNLATGNLNPPPPPPLFPEKLNGSSLIDITLLFDKNKICKSTFIQCYFCVLYRLSSLYLTGCFYYTFVTTNYIKSLICNIYFEVQGCVNFFLKGDLIFSFFFR